MTNLQKGPTKTEAAIDKPIQVSRLVERTQYDTLQDEYSILTGVDLSGTEQLTRQEMRDEADINNILNRYGVTAPQRELRYGEEIDYTLDLQTALGALDAAERANFNVPEELRQKYPSWRDLLNAVESGQYQHDLEQLAAKKAAEAQNKAPGQPPDPMPGKTSENSEQASQN